MNKINEEVKRDAKCKVDYEKEIWEGWKVIDFINEIEIGVDYIINCCIPKDVKLTLKQLEELCVQEQPYYKKVIPDVVNYFANKYQIS